MSSAPESRPPGSGRPASQPPLARARRIGGASAASPSSNPAASGASSGAAASTGADESGAEAGRVQQQHSEAAQPEQPVRKSRAGRDLGAAIGVGVLLGAVIIVTLVFYRPSFAVIVGIAALYGCYELSVALRSADVRIALTPLLAGTVATLLAAWFRGPNGLVAGVLLSAVAVLAWCLADGAAGFPRRVGASLFVLLYVPALAAFAILSVHAPDGAARVLAFVVLVVCSDTGGYATGVLFGRHPLAPIVSKGKTWEGFAGSALFCCVAGILFLTLVFHQAWWKGLVFGVAILVTATSGDLGESMIKRDIGIKDMGSLLPGHGGLMDRLDSMLPCAAVGYLLLSLFAPV